MTSIPVLLGTLLALVLVQCEPQYDSSTIYTPYHNSSDPHFSTHRPYNSDDRYNPDNRYNDPNNRYNPDNRDNRYNPDNRYNDPNNRYNDPNNRYNDPNNRYNDPNNRNNDPNNRYNDPNNRYNPDNRYNDPNNRYNPDNRNNDPNNRYNPDNRYGQDRHDQRYPPDPRNRYNVTPYTPDSRYPDNRYNPNAPYNPNQPYNPYNNRTNYSGGPQDRYPQHPYYPNQGGYGADARDILRNHQPQYPLSDNCCENYCYFDDRDPYSRFATKTAYELFFGRTAGEQHLVPDCTPIQFWSLNRHATRYPSINTLRDLRKLQTIRNEIIENYERRNSYPDNGRLCDQDLNLFKRWFFNNSITDDRANTITSQGIEDMKLLARRFRSRFPDLFREPFNQNTYHFQYTDMDRTHDTYQAYIEGLFGLQETYRVQADVLVDDRMSRTPGCRSWGSQSYQSGGGYGSNQYNQNQPGYNQYNSQQPGYNQYNSQQQPHANDYNRQGNDYNRQGNDYNRPGNDYNRPDNDYNRQGNDYNRPGNDYNRQGGGYQGNDYNRQNDQEYLQEYENFKRRREYQQMVKDVLRKLGFRNLFNEEAVADIYDMCRFEKAWFPRERSPWCAAFTNDQLKMLEFAEDLKYYYKSGYGNRYSDKIGCPPVKDLFDKFQRTVNGDRSNKVTAIFTHTKVFQSFLVAMGIAKDDVRLTADTPYAHNTRKWQTSKISPFSANVAAVLYECHRGDPFKVMFFLNEEPLRFPECDVGLCSWEAVRQKIEYIAMNCNSEYCGGGSASPARLSFFLSLLAVFPVLRLVF